MAAKLIITLTLYCGKYCNLTQCHIILCTIAHQLIMYTCSTIHSKDDLNLEH